MLLAALFAAPLFAQSDECFGRGRDYYVTQDSCFGGGPDSMTQVKADNSTYDAQDVGVPGVPIPGGGFVSVGSLPNQQHMAALPSTPEPVSYSYQSGPGTITVTVYPKSGEGDASLAGRLFNRVQAMFVLFPPNTP
jgi:hypothetical protein